MIPSVKKFVEPVAVILSECLKTYFSLKSHGYHHLTVNHLIEFNKKRDLGLYGKLIENIYFLLVSTVTVTVPILAVFKQRGKNIERTAFVQ